MFKFNNFVIEITQALCVMHIFIVFSCKVKFHTFPWSRYVVSICFLLSSEFFFRKHQSSFFALKVKHSLQLDTTIPNNPTFSLIRQAWRRGHAEIRNWNR